MWEQLSDALRQSTSRIITGVASFLPGVLALVAAVVLALPLAWIAGRVVRKVLRGVQFDERLERWGVSGMAEWSPDRSPTLLLERVAYWSILLLGLLVGLTALNADLTSRLAVRAVDYLPNIFAAVLVLVVGSLVARFLARGVLISAVNMQLQAARLISLGVKWLILVCAAAMALDHLGIGGAIVRLAFGILFGGIVLAMALAVGLGSKDVVTRSWERREEKAAEEPQPFRHL
jgi:hypothetical protein